MPSLDLRDEEEAHRKAWDTRGRGRTGPGTSYAALLSRVASPDGGFTQRPLSGVAPKKGYAVSVFRGRERAIPAHDVTIEALAEFVQQNRDALSQPGSHFGAWHNPEDGNVYLDISRVVDNEAEAERLSREHHQIAYFNLKAGHSVPVSEHTHDAYRPETSSDTHRESKARSLGGALRTVDWPQADAGRAGEGEGDSRHTEELNLERDEEEAHRKAWDTRGRKSLDAPSEASRFVRPTAGVPYHRPIPVRVDSPDRAVDLILQGHVVELTEVRHVATVLTKLAAFAQDAIAKGEAAPNYDLCQVTIPGTNLFCGSKLHSDEFPNGVPRIEMPQMTGLPRPGTPADALPRGARGTVDASKQFVAHLKELGIAATAGYVPAARLKASQAELIGRKVAAMVARGKDYSTDPIFVSRDNYIIDGHHRWAAVVANDAMDNKLGDAMMAVVKIDAPISEVLHVAKDWQKSFGVQSGSGHPTALREFFAAVFRLAHGFDDAARVAWNFERDEDEAHRKAWDTRGRGRQSDAKKGPRESDAGPRFRPVTDEDKDRLAKLRVPPAWTNVHLSKDPKADLQVKGMDAGGHWQYLYAAAHAPRKAAEKFARLKAFNEKLPALRESIVNDLKRGADVRPTERDAALVLYLIDKTAFRIGSNKETGALVKAYGASTLEADHVKIHGDEVSFSFTGKKGVQIDKTVTDKRLARLLAPRVKAGGPLFNASNNAIRNYLKSRTGAEFKVHDLRTWHATTLALKTIKTMTTPRNKAQFKKAQREVSKVVAAHLVNEPSEAKNSYIDPAVWSRWMARAKV